MAHFLPALPQELCTIAIGWNGPDGIPEDVNATLVTSALPPFTPPEVFIPGFKNSLAVVKNSNYQALVATEKLRESAREETALIQAHFLCPGKKIVYSP